MDELPPEYRGLLSHVKDAHDPPDGGPRARVRQRMALTLGAAATAGAWGAASSAGAQVLRASKVLFGGAVGKVGLAVTAAAAIGGGSLLVSSHDELPAARPSVFQSVAVAAPAAPDSSARPAVAPAPQAAPVPALALAAPSPAPARTRPRAQRAIDTLPAEVALLREAERALAAGETARALALVRKHRARFAKPVLREERDGLGALAHCLVDPHASAAEARAFLARFSRSLLGPRVAKACRLDEPAR